VKIRRAGTPPPILAFQGAKPDAGAVSRLFRHDQIEIVPAFTLVPRLAIRRVQQLRNHTFTAARQNGFQKLATLTGGGP
jgi:hypothetical protein